MDINDYLIAQEGIDWQGHLEEWGFLLPESFTIWMVNLLGDMVLVSDTEEVLFLELGAGTLEKIADSKHDFASKVAEGDNANLWFAFSLVDECKKEGKILGASECYSYKIAPILGGEYLSSNLVPTDLSVHYHLLGQIHKQLKDAPYGTKVNISMADDT